MGYTKRQIIEDAFEEIGLANYVFDLQAEQTIAALRKLDRMLAYWNVKGLRLGYPLTTNPDNSEIDSDSNLQDAANEAVVLNLAIRIAPSVGKVVSSDTKVNAKNALNALMSVAAMPEQRQITSLPRGQGNKSWRSSYYRFLKKPQERDTAFPED